METISPTRTEGTEEKVHRGYVMLLTFLCSGEHMQRSNLEELFRNMSKDTRENPLSINKNVLKALDETKSRNVFLFMSP